MSWIEVLQSKTLKVILRHFNCMHTRFHSGELLSDQCVLNEDSSSLQKDSSPFGIGDGMTKPSVSSHQGKAHLSKLICPQLQVAKAGDKLVSDHSLDIKGEYYSQNSHRTSTYKFFAFFAICTKFLPNWKVPCWPFRSWPMCFCGTTFSGWTLTNFPIKLKIALLRSMQQTPFDLLEIPFDRS